MGSTGPFQWRSQAEKATLSTFNIDPRTNTVNETSVKLFDVGQNPIQQILLPGRSRPIFSVCYGLLLVFAAWTETK